LNSPIVVVLADVSLSCDELTTEDPTSHGTDDQFFHHICSGVFDALLAAGKGRTGIFGEVSNYFGSKPTGGLIWLTGNLEFFTVC
jgi:hypothetical protein